MIEKALPFQVPLSAPAAATSFDRDGSTHVCIDASDRHPSSAPLASCFELDPALGVGDAGAS